MALTGHRTLQKASRIEFNRRSLASQKTAQFECWTWYISFDVPRI